MVTTADRGGASTVERSTAEPRLRWWFLAVVVTAAVPRLLTATHFVTTDEPTWMRRSVRFSDALTGLDLSNASASVGEPATMPGGPTMWIGTVARMLWGLADSAGLVDSRSFTSMDGLAIAQLLTALVTAAAIGWLFVVVARWAGLVPAVVVALVLATDPWLVGLGAVLHTDELTALFGTIGLVGLARTLGIPDRSRRPSRPALAAAFAGVALMLSALTKVTGTGYWVGAAVVAVWALVRSRRAGRGWFDERAPLRLCGVAALAGLAIVPIVWPAVVVDPVFQADRLMASAGLATESSNFRSGARQFYLGEPEDAPGWHYYPVALALRVTPWLLAVLVVGIPAALARPTRRHLLALAAPVLALFVVLTRSPKSFDRYGLLLLVPALVVAAIGLDGLRRRFEVPDRLSVRVLGAVGALALVFSLSVAPWGLAYFNPALGGSRAGHDNLLVGWGEGKEQAAERIRQLEDGRCARVTVDGLAELWIIGVPCTSPPFGDAEARYVVLYVNDLQRRPDLRDRVAGRELIDVIEVRDIPYVEIWS